MISGPSERSRSAVMPAMRSPSALIDRLVRLMMLLVSAWCERCPAVRKAAGRSRTRAGARFSSRAWVAWKLIWMDMAEAREQRLRIAAQHVSHLVWLKERAVRERVGVGLDPRHSSE